jgi:predicted SprT family Zn-dependent metalloprotease
MDLLAAKATALLEMSTHGLLRDGWKFKFNRARLSFGVCSYRTRTIKLSAPLTELNQDDQVLNTIRHEIAHALTPGDHHGPAWKQKAIELGCNGERVIQQFEIKLPPTKYSVRCPVCGAIYGRSRRPPDNRPRYCTACFRKGYRRPVEYYCNDETQLPLSVPKREESYAKD